MQPSPRDCCCCTVMVWVARGQCAGPSGAGSLRNVFRCPLSRGCSQSRAGEHPRLPGRGGGKHAPQWHGLAPPRPRAEGPMARQAAMGDAPPEGFLIRP
jgi:hypothetical protein